MLRGGRSRGRSRPRVDPAERPAAANKHEPCPRLQRDHAHHQPPSSGGDRVPLWGLAVPARPSVPVVGRACTFAQVQTAVKPFFGRPSPRLSGEKQSGRDLRALTTELEHAQDTPVNENGRGRLGISTPACQRKTNARIETSARGSRDRHTIRRVSREVLPLWFSSSSLATIRTRLDRDELPLRWITEGGPSPPGNAPEASTRRVCAGVRCTDERPRIDREPIRSPW